MAESNVPAAHGEDFLLAESYSTFWDAIPIDSGELPSHGSDSPIMGSEDPYADFLMLTEEGAPSWLSVEETDVG